MHFFPKVQTKYESKRSKKTFSFSFPSLYVNFYRDDLPPFFSNEKIKKNVIALNELFSALPIIVDLQT